MMDGAQTFFVVLAIVCAWAHGFGRGCVRGFVESAQSCFDAGAGFGRAASTCLVAARDAKCTMTKFGRVVTFDTDFALKDVEQCGRNK
jgi:hypothetical protein